MFGAVWDVIAAALNVVSAKPFASRREAAVVALGIVAIAAVLVVIAVALAL
jgi:hypothetical protein